jgi:PST family polysaccharide transporter
MRRVAVRSAGITVFSGAIRVAVQMVGTVTLARLIAPRDYGLVTMVTTFSFMLVGCASNGLPEAVVQSRKVTRRLANNLFWIYAGLGLVCSVGFAGLGPLLANFYGEPSLVGLAAGMALSVFFAFLAVVHFALLQKAMLFSVTARNEIYSRAASVLVSIALAWKGWGCWALVWGSCAYPFVLMLLTWNRCRWLPGRPRRDAETGVLLRFAVHAQGHFSVNYGTSNTDNLLIGWRMGPRILGNYKRAYDLFCLAATQLVSTTTLVAVSALSRVREDREQYARYLTRAIAIIAFLGMGLAGNLTLVGRDVIRLLLGPNWDQAGWIFTYFAPGIGMMLVYGTHSWIHLSIGRADRWFRWGIVEWTVTTLLFVVGVFHGPEGVAVAWGLSFWILIVPAMRYAIQPTGLSLRPLVSVIGKYVLAGGIALGAGLLLQFDLHWFDRASGALEAARRILVLTVSFTIFYLGAIILVHRSFQPIRDLMRLTRDLRSSGKEQSTPVT